MGQNFAARLTLCFLFWIVKGKLVGNGCDSGGQKDLKTCETKFLGMPLKASVAVVGSKCSPSVVVNLHVQAKNRSVNWRRVFASTSKVPIPGLTIANAYGEGQVVVKVHLIQPNFEHVGVYEVKLLTRTGPTGSTASFYRLTLARGLIVKEMCDNAKDFHESKWWEESKIFIFAALPIIALLSALIILLGCCRESPRLSAEGPYDNLFQLTPYSPDRKDMNDKCIASSVWAGRSLDDMYKINPRASHDCQVDSDSCSVDHSVYDTNIPSGTVRQDKLSRSCSIRSGSFVGSDVML